MLSLILLIHLSILTVCAGSSFNMTRSLFADLYNSYDPEYRPVYNKDDVIAVSVTFYPRIIHQLDERHQRFVTSGWFTCSWRDQLLIWDKSKYGNLSSIATKKFWRPDIVILNGYKDSQDLTQSGFKAIVESDGQIRWSPAKIFETHCSIDVTFYPFDVQTCSIELLAWTYPDTAVKLVPSPVPVKFDFYQKSGEWRVLNTTTARQPLPSEQTGEGSVSLVFNITVARRRAFFVISMLVPAISESILCNLVFLVPSESGERMSLSITVLLSYAVFLSVTNESFPKSSLNTPVLSVYMLFVFLLGTLAVLLTGISLFLYHSPKSFSNTPTSDNGPVPDIAIPPKSDPKLTKRKVEKHVGDLEDTKLPYLDVRKDTDRKKHSRVFDRVCFLIIFSLTLTSIFCLLVLLTSRDIEMGSYINSARM